MFPGVSCFKIDHTFDSRKNTLNWIAYQPKEKIHKGKKCKKLKKRKQSKKKHCTCRNKLYHISLCLFGLNVLYSNPINIKESKKTSTVETKIQSLYVGKS